MEFKPISKDILCLIPKYDGEENQLNFFLSKCDYVISGSRIPGNLAQNLYLFHAVSSKLCGRAATLLSDYPNISTYESLKEILTQHFGDPRSEECIAIELETLKLKQGETYIQFGHRIQNIRSSLFAKVNRITDEGIKVAKMIVYNNTALNVFLYNLPEDMIRIVRLKGCPSLETALSIVTEEVNFKFQYDMKNKLFKQNTLTNQTNAPISMKPLATAAQGFKPVFNSAPNNLKFGIPQNQGGFRPNFVQQPKFVPPTQGTPQYGTPQNQYFSKFGQAPEQSAPFQQGGFKFGIPQQHGNKLDTPNQPQAGNQLKFSISDQKVQAPRYQDSDVSMRTAPIRQNNMTVNELFFENPSPYNHDYNYRHGENAEYSTIECNYIENLGEVNATYLENTNPEDEYQELAAYPENFQEPFHVTVFENKEGKQNCNTDALSSIQINALSDEDVLMKDNIDKEQQIKRHISNLTNKIILSGKNQNEASGASTTREVPPSPVVISTDSEISTVVASEGRRSPYSNPSLSSITPSTSEGREHLSTIGTAHSAQDLDTDGMLILQEAIDTKPNQILIHPWNRNDILVKHLSRDKQKVLEVHLPLNNLKLIKRFLKSYIKSKIKYFFYFEDELHRKQFSEVSLALFQKGTVKFKDKPRYQKAQVTGAIERNVVPVITYNRKTKVPIIDIKHPPQVISTGGGPSGSPSAPAG